MALADITLNDGAETPVAHTFAYIGSENGRVVRRDMARTPDLPLQMTIGHTKTTRNGVKVDSHLVKFDYAAMDADGVTVRWASIRTIVDCDPDIYSDALADDLAALTRNYLSSTNARLLCRGSVG